MFVSINATQSITLMSDGDTDTFVNPGETLLFSVVIVNSGSTAATGVTFTETLDGLTLVPGSVNVSPLAQDDTYDALGNTDLTITLANSLFGNDLEFLSDTFTLSTFDAASTKDGGGTVGNLTIADVAVSGSGEAIAINQGGTLDVTLDSLTSSSLATEGVLLNDVGGSLTVTGTGGISGSTGFGIAMTGANTVTATFAGGTTLTNPGADTLIAITVTLTNNQDGADEGLSVSAAALNALGGVSGQSAITRQDMIAVTGASASSAEVAAFLQAITYDDVSNVPNEPPRTIAVAT